MNNNPHRHREPHDGEAPQFFEPILEYYWNLPVITRTWFSLSLLVTTLNTLDLFPEHQLIFIWDRVQPPYLELWRIVTAFTWAGPGTIADFPVLMLLYAMVLSVSSYETNPHETGQRSRRLNRHETKSDCLFALICCSILIVGTYLVVTETAYLDQFFYSLGLDEIWLQPLFTRTLEYSMLTLDSFRNPDRTVNINLFPIQGRYVPLFHIGFAIMMGYRTIEIFHGILVATIYFMLIMEEGFFASMLGRKRVIFKPQCLMRILGEELEEENDQQHNMMPEEGGNILHRAAASNDLPVILGKLRQLESVSPVNMAVATALFRQKDENGWQPLHEATRGGHVDVLKLLLEIEDDQRRNNRLNVDINAITNEGRGCTALWLAEQNYGEDSAVAQLLRNNGGVSIGGIFADDDSGQGDNNNEDFDENSEDGSIRNEY